MLFNKEEALARCDKYHDKNGRIYETLEAVLNDTSLPAGTNYALEFVDRLVNLGIPYVATSMQMDTGADCLEFWRIIIYIFTGKDVGVNTRAAAANTKLGVRIDDRTQMRPLDIMFLDLSAAYNVSHAMGRVLPNEKGEEMVHTTQVRGTTFDLRYQDREYYMKKYGEDVYRWCMRFVTDEELASMTVAGDIPVEPEQEEDMIQFGQKNENVREWQKSLQEEYPLALPKYGADSDFGKETLSATKAFQKRMGVAETGKVDDDTQAAMWRWQRENVNVTELKALEVQAKSLGDSLASLKEWEAGVLTAVHMKH